MSERKLGFSSKHNAVTLLKKRTQHTTHYPLQCRCLVRLRLRVASLATVARYYRSATTSTPPLHSKKKKANQTTSPRANLHAERVMKTSPHFVCGADQPDPHFACLSEMNRPTLSPLNICISLGKFFLSLL